MSSRFNLPPLTRALLGINLALSALNMTLRLEKWTKDPTSAAAAATYASDPRWAVPYLVIVPLYSLRFPWTLLTAAYVENNLISLAVSGLVLWFGGRYLEHAWGQREFGKFMVLVAVVPNAITMMLYGLWHFATTKPAAPTPIQGLVAVEAGFLVALKQLVPEHTVSLLKGTIRIRIKHFPALFTVANILSGPLLGTDTAFWLSLIGFLTAWIHLRFFRVTEITSATTGEAATMKGDASDTFTFAAFFPDAVQPLLTPICDGIYSTLVQLRLCTPFSDEAVASGNENVASRSVALPTTMNDGGTSAARRAEAERRRALALRALDQRLNANAATATPNTTSTEGLSLAREANSPEAPVSAEE